MGTLTIPNTLEAGAEIVIEDHNENYTAIAASINGDLEDTNIRDSADIDPSKIGDYSATAAEMKITIDPGEVGSEAFASLNTMENDIAALRFAIDELRGTAQWYASNAADAAGAIKNLADLPVGIGQNLLINGGFDAGAAADTSSTGWTVVEEATLALAATEVGEGAGLELNVTAHAATGADDGISQTLVGLKAATTYVFVGSVKPSAAGSSGTGDNGIITTGNAGDGGTDLNLEFDGADSTSYTVKTGTFTTGATPADVVFKVLLDANDDAVACDNFSIVELDLVNRRAGPGRIVNSISSTAEGTALAGTWTDWEATSSGPVDLQVSVQVPGPGYYIRVDAVLNAESEATKVDMYTAIAEKVDGGGFSRVSWATTTEAAELGDPLGCTLHYIQKAPVGGSVYTYKAQGVSSSGIGDCAPNKDSADGDRIESYMTLECIPYG